MKLKRTKIFMSCILTGILAALLFLNCSAGPQKMEYKITDLDPVKISANTEFKPQSKVWKYDNTWWAVLPDSEGTFIWKLNATQWQKTLRIADWTDSHADVKSVNDLAHILLFRGEYSGLVSVQYDKASGKYKMWEQRPEISPITYHPDTEAASMDMDSNGRLWSAFDTLHDVMVIYSDAPYTEWSAPVPLANDIYKDDICALTALPGKKIAVLWSNQDTKRFGFRMHKDGDAPETWSMDEQPASQSALDEIGDGMADDHLNMCVANDGTLFVSVKTSYDTKGYPKIAFLRRHSNGTWDDLVYVDDDGTRGIICLNELTNDVLLFYSLHHRIKVRKSDADVIDFSPAEIAIDAQLNNATGPKHNVTDDLVIIASEADTAKSVLIQWK